MGVSEQKTEVQEHRISRNDHRMFLCLKVEFFLNDHLKITA